MSVNNDNVCAAVERSPEYDGKKLEASMGKPFREWTATTNITLDKLGCPI